MAGGQGWKPKTKATYEMRMRAHILPRWRDEVAGSVTRRDIEDWIADLLKAGRGPATVREVVRELSQVFDAAVDAGSVRSNPCDRVRLPRAVHTEVRPLAFRQVAALADAISRPEVLLAGNGARSTRRPDRPDLALAVRISAYCGLRADELWALRRRSVDLEGRTLRVTESVTDVAGRLVFGTPKTHRSRAVPVPAPLVGEIAAHLATSVLPAPTALLFTGETGCPFGTRRSTSGTSSQP